MDILFHRCFPSQSYLPFLPPLPSCHSSFLYFFVPSFLPYFPPSLPKFFVLIWLCCHSVLPGVQLVSLHC